MISEAEKALLGLCMKDESSFGKALALGVSPSTFQSHKASEIFAAMLAAEKAGKPFDLVALGVALPEYVGELIDMATDAPLTQNIDHFAREVLEASWTANAERELKEVLAVVKKRKPFESRSVVRAQAVYAVERISHGPDYEDKAPKDIYTVLEKKLNPELERRIAAFKAGKPTGVPTGLTSLDLALGGGWQPGGLYTIGARMGRGKTTFAINVARSGARAGSHVGYWTLEMPDWQIAVKLVSLEAGLDGRKIAVGALNSDEDIDALHAAQACLSELPLHIDDSWGGSLEAFMLASRSLHRRGLLSVAILDYLGLMTIPGERFASKTALLGEITGRLKRFAQELKLTVIVLAQLNRDAEKDDDAPGTHHIKDSDAVGADSDAVILLYRTPDDQTMINISKNRWGPEVQFAVTANLAKNLFTDANTNSKGVFGE